MFKNSQNSKRGKEWFMFRYKIWSMSYMAIDNGKINIDVYTETGEDGVYTGELRIVNLLSFFFSFFNFRNLNLKTDKLVRSARLYP